MTNHVSLDNIAHGDLRVSLRYGADVGDAINQVLIFPTEFEQVQREYPIVMRRDERGNFYAVALLGFERDENLFLDGDRWDARYVPAIRQRGPFMSPAPDALKNETPTILKIDLDDPRVGAPDGEPLFLRHGGRAPYLRHMANVVEAVSEGHRTMAPAFTRLADAGLLHATAIKIELGDGQSVVVEDVHVVTRESLASLTASALETLSQNGLLYIAHMAAASLETMNHLIARHQQKRGMMP
jgi:SapC